jgi:hypothetical protein
VEYLMQRSRGCEIPGTYNPPIINELFLEQSKPWRVHLQNYEGKILQAVTSTIKAVLSHVIDEKTKVQLWDDMIKAGFGSLKDVLCGKVTELLALYESGQAITYDDNLTETVQKF